MFRFATFQETTESFKTCETVQQCKTVEFWDIYPSTVHSFVYLLPWTSIRFHCSLDSVQFETVRLFCRVYALVCIRVW